MTFGRTVTCVSGCTSTMAICKLSHSDIRNVLDGATSCLCSVILSDDWQSILANGIMYLASSKHAADILTRPFIAVKAISTQRL